MCTTKTKSQIVADSSALTLLEKCSLLNVLCDSFVIIVPESVAIGMGSEDSVRHYPDAALISDMLAQGIIKVQCIENNDRFSSPLSLHKGEEDALLLSIKLGKLLFATDDGKALKAAKFFSVPFIITPKIVVDLFKLKRISFQKARKSIEKLAKIGRYSPEIIADALVSLMEGNNDQTNNDKDTGRIIE